MEKKFNKTCEMCKFVCKKNKICKHFIYGIKEYQVCFYNDFGNGIPSCCDESFYDAKNLESTGLALSYIGNPNVRVFVIYYDGTRKELVMINCIDEEASYLDGTNDLNIHNKDYNEKHNKIIEENKKYLERKKDI